MPRRSNEFQKLVALIHGCLGDSGKVTESALLVDRATGEKRGVDVLIEISGFLISVEVRDRTRKAGIAWVEEMHAKHSDLATDKLVLVSRNGYYRTALDKARFHGIETMTFADALWTQIGI
jgi:hypothetical protein